MMSQRRKNGLLTLFSLGILMLALHIWSTSRQVSRPLLTHGVEQKPPRANKKSKRTKYVSPYKTDIEYPPAVRAFQQYQQAYNQDVLLDIYKRNKTSLIDDRKYAIAYYWCPQRMGNILHSFFNTMSWAMMHNRTVLWKYHGFSHQVSTEQECHEILERPSWLPSYDEWSEKLPHLKNVVSIEMVDFHENEHNPIVLYPQISDVLTKGITGFTGSWPKDPSASHWHDYRTTMPNKYQEIKKQLFSEGKKFLFGMLYENIFKLRLPIAEKVFGKYLTNETKASSIALHSRHVVGADDGSYVDTEYKCLTNMIAQMKKDEPQNKDCVAYLMSDRSKTIDLLTDWLTQHGCTAIIGDQSTIPKLDDIPEHGPFSGAGFLLDLHVVGQAKSAMVGDVHRSSTALLMYAVEYNRIIYAVENGEKPADELPLCRLQNKQLSGYDYGPGTPTFRHHSFLQPLDGLAVMNKYKEEFQDEKKKHDKFIVSSINMDTPTPDDVYAVLNSFLLAIVTDRTLVVINECGDDCREDRNLRQNAFSRKMSVDLMDKVSDQTSIAITDRESIQSMQQHAVIKPSFGQNHFSRQEFADLIGTESELMSNTLELLYAQGSQFLYGMLFQEAFAVAVRADPPWDVGPSVSMVVDLKDEDSKPDVEKCLVSMISDENNNVPEDTSCHIFLLTDLESAPTKIGPCTATAIDLSLGDGKDIHTYWSNIDLISRARSGWIVPEQSSQLRATSLLIKENIDYFRYQEVWRLGRDPFLISNIQLCKY